MDQREVKHRSTMPPIECEHCGKVWYGMYHGSKFAPETVLCLKCWNELDTYYCRNHRDLYDLRRESPWAADPKKITNEQSEQITKLTQAWIQNKKNTPHSRQKSFDASVPRWMRSAIKSGMIKTNEKIAYIVYSQGQIARRVEVTTQSTLRPTFR